MGFLHVLILILKIIGIVLLSILGLLLAALLLVLFVPVRYRIFGHKREDIRASLKATWLLHLLSITAAYEGNGIEYAVKIFGHSVADNKAEDDRQRHAEDRHAEDRHKATADSDIIQIADKKAEEHEPEGHGPEGHKSEEHEFEEHESEEHESEKHEPEEDRKADVKTDEILLKAAPEDKPKVKISIFAKIKAKLDSIIKKIKWILGAPIRLFKKIKRKCILIYRYIRDEQNVEAVKLIFNSVGKLLKHIAPQKIKGWVNFGTGDPCTTGQILGVIGIFYGRCMRHLVITPDFENAVFEGEVNIKGRITVARLLYIAARLWFDKNFKQLKENTGQLKTDLSEA